MKRLAVLFLGLTIGFLGFSQEVKWLSIEEAVKKNAENPKKIVVDVYTDWCGWCKVMDKNTFKHPVIAKYLNENFYAVKLNAEQKEDIILNGTTYKFVEQGRRGYHELAAKLLNGNMGYPSVVFLDEQVRVIQPLSGYIKPQPFDEIINFIGSDKYKTQSWDDFQASFTSTIPEDSEANL